MQVRSVLAGILSLLLVACAAVPEGDPGQDAALKKFQPKPNVAGVYIYRNEGIGALVGMDVEVDGKPVGRTGPMTYLYTEVPGGSRTVTSKAENTDQLQFNAVPGRLYYVWQEVKMGFLSARTKLHLMKEEEGRKGVLETKLTVPK
jgi:hypothetical protein